ncbi:hypothetical protein [Acinetobacter sp. CFCC 10889]|uniref:hypothetical protein n=1 Tax=Acinetobacter sp. CFCC 10889 TaxID=1775557 RepID=UPI0013A6CB2F|nr:hypothetical protein [Acinetobacter sp. CFCC 10889]
MRKEKILKTYIHTGSFMHSLKVILIILICSVCIYSKIGFLKFFGIFILIFVFLYLFLLGFMTIYNRILFPNLTHDHFEKNQNQQRQTSILNPLSKVTYGQITQPKISIEQQFQNFKAHIYTQLDAQNQAFLNEIEMIFQDIEQRKQSAKFNMSKKLNRQLQSAQHNCLKQSIRLLNADLYNKNRTFEQHEILENLLKKIEFLYQNDLQSLLDHQHFIQKNLDVKQVFKLNQTTKSIWQNNEE